MLENPFKTSESEELLETPIKERESVLSRLYKNKFARTLTLLTALGMSAGNFMNDYEKSRNTGEQRNELVVNRPEQINLSIGEVKIKVEGKGPIIVHLPQIHGADSISETDKSLLDRREKTGEQMSKEDIINSQKKIEGAILELKDKYNVDTVIVESVDQDIMEMIKSIKASLARYDSGEKDSLGASQLFERVNNKDEIPMPDRYRAYLLYAILDHEQNQVSTLKKDISLFKEGKEINDKFKRLFQNKDTEIQTVVLEQEERVLSSMKSNNLINGENMYLWGGAMKLFLEGKIQVEPAETFETNQKAFSQKTMTEANITREEEGIRLAAKYAKDHSKGVIPLVYGQGHDFTSTVKKWNENNKDSSFALGRIEWRGK